MIGYFLRSGAVIGAVMTIITAWAYFELPRPAWSTELDVVEQKQLDMQSDYYRDKLDDLTILKLKLEGTSELTNEDRSYIYREIDKTQKKLDEIDRRRQEIR